MQPVTTAASLSQLDHGPRDMARGGTNVAALFDVLEGEIARAGRHHRDLSIAVFDVPLAFARHRQLALRNSVCSHIRGTDIPVWLSNNTLALVLPETGPGVLVATERLARMLSDVAGGPVAAGCARFPEDGQSASELLRSAVRQKRAAPICAVGGALVRPETPALGETPALPEACPGADSGATPIRRATDGLTAPGVDGGEMEIARAEFLRAALRLAEMEALSRDPAADGAATRVCLRELAASLGELGSAECLELPEHAEAAAAA